MVVTMSVQLLVRCLCMSWSVLTFPNRKVIIKRCGLTRVRYYSYYEYYVKTQKLAEKMGCLDSGEPDEWIIVVLTLVM